ncbi:UNVERIFIED_CONTAM: hypothetical protein FKN15_043675 [Acipenser sinensis]
MLLRYLLQPKDNGNKTSKTDDLGSLRVNLTYTEDHVLPSNYYISLRDLLLKSPDVKPISASAAHVLCDICRERYEAVLPVVRLLLHYSKLVPFVTAVAELELEQTQEANTIFRGNSLATRCLDDMMKIVGKRYLIVTLKPVLDEICESNKPCEIDPIKLKEGDNVEVNKENLHQYVQKVFNSIVHSSMSCPTLMCDMFNALRQMATKRFPVCPKWAKLCKNHTEQKSVVMLIVCSSAHRVLDLIKQLTTFKGNAKVLKLFAKHIKVEEQIKLLQKGVTHMGVGTPGRIKALAEQDGLSLKALKYVVLDWNWRDQKLRRMPDIPEVKCVGLSSY